MVGNLGGGNMTTRSFHLCLGVRGALRWTNKELKGLLENDGKPLNAAEVRTELLRELAMGHEVIPIGRCHNFDWKTGCRGHIVDEELGEVTTA
jgi:hypothetical protein